MDKLHTEFSRWHINLIKRWKTSLDCINAIKTIINKLFELKFSISFVRFAVWKGKSPNNQMSLRFIRWFVCLFLLRKRWCERFNVELIINNTVETLQSHLGSIYRLDFHSLSQWKWYQRLNDLNWTFITWNLRLNCALHAHYTCSSEIKCIHESIAYMKIRCHATFEEIVHNLLLLLWQPLTNEES